MCGLGEDIVVDKIVESLKRIRINPSPYEYDLQKIVADRFTRDGIPFVPEYVLGKNARIDFFVFGIGIEVKKGIPNRTNVLRQLERYAEYEEIKYLILVSERKIHEIPSTIGGKPCMCIILSRNWGVAL